MIADLNSRGNIVIPKSSYLAAVWSRSVAEATTILGKYQYDAILAYKNQNW